MGHKVRALTATFGKEESQIESSCGKAYASRIGFEFLGEAF